MTNITQTPPPQVDEARPGTPEPSGTGPGPEAHGTISRDDERPLGRSVGFWVVAASLAIVGVAAATFGLRAVVGPKAAAPVAADATVAAPLATVALTDFTMQPSTATVAAGQATVQITNSGKVAHELLVFRSDLKPSAYPKKDGNLDEEGAGITKISDGENLDPGATQTRTIDLTRPGTYLFVCNLPGHFKAGMYKVVTVR